MLFVIETERNSCRHFPGTRSLRLLLRTSISHVIQCCLLLRQKETHVVTFQALGVLDCLLVNPVFESTKGELVNVARGSLVIS